MITTALLTAHAITTARIAADLARAEDQFWTDQVRRRSLVDPDRPGNNINLAAVHATGITEALLGRPASCSYCKSEKRQPGNCSNCGAAR